MNTPPPPVPGIIDGSMTVHTETGGGVSIRVVIRSGRPASATAAA